MASKKGNFRKFVVKVVQLFETFNVRFGVMLVGPTGGGKTACYQTLKDALSTLRSKDECKAKAKKSGGGGKAGGKGDGKSQECKQQ